MSYTEDNISRINKDYCKKSEIENAAKREMHKLNGECASASEDRYSDARRVGFNQGIEFAELLMAREYLNTATKTLKNKYGEHAPYQMRLALTHLEDAQTRLTKHIDEVEKQAR